MDDCFTLLFVYDKCQHGSAIGWPLSPPTWSSLSPPAPPHPSRLFRSPRLSSLSCTSNAHWLHILNSLTHSHWLCSLRMAMYGSMFLSPSLPPSPSPAPSRVHPPLLCVCISIAVTEFSLATTAPRCLGFHALMWEDEPDPLDSGI